MGMLPSTAPAVRRPQLTLKLEPALPASARNAKPTVQRFSPVSKMFAMMNSL